MDAPQRILNSSAGSASPSTARRARSQAAEASGEARAPASPEVEISREARARQALGRRSAPAAVSSAAALPPGPSDTVESRSAAADRAARSGRSGRAARADRAEDRSRERESDRSLGASPVLAVRVGVPPIGEIGNAQKAPTAAEAALRERAVLRDVGQVLSLPATEKPREVERKARKLRSEEPAVEGSVPDEELVLGGSSRGDPAPRSEPARAPERPAPERSVELSARDPRVARPAPPPVRELSAEERRLRELTVQKQLGESDVREVSAVIGGSGSGAVRDPNEAARQIPLPGDGSRGEAFAGQVQRAATQFSVIEAQATDELVTRFLGSSPPQDPGPEPRFREPLE